MDTLRQRIEARLVRERNDMDFAAVMASKAGELTRQQAAESFVFWDGLRREHLAIVDALLSLLEEPEQADPITAAKARSADQPPGVQMEEWGR